MDHGKRQEQWNHTGDLAYIIAASQGSKSVTQFTFNRYHQMHKPAAPKRMIKPSELLDLG